MTQRRLIAFILSFVGERCSYYLKLLSVSMVGNSKETSHHGSREVTDEVFFNQISDAFLYCHGSVSVKIYPSN